MRKTTVFFPFSRVERTRKRQEKYGQTLSEQDWENLKEPD